MVTGFSAARKISLREVQPAGSNYRLYSTLVEQQCRRDFASFSRLQGRHRQLGLSSRLRARTGGGPVSGTLREERLAAIVVTRPRKQ